MGNMKVKCLLLFSYMFCMLSGKVKHFVNGSRVRRKINMASQQGQKYELIKNTFLHICTFGILREAQLVYF